MISTLTTLNTLRALLDGVVVVLSAASVRVKRRREMRAGVWRNTTILYHRSTDNLKYANLLGDIVARACQRKSSVKTD